MFWTSPEDEIAMQLISGPFDSEAELKKALIEKYRYNSGLDYKASYYRRVLPLVLKNNSPTFTHGDFQRKNIILKDSGNVVLVDWETAQQVGIRNIGNMHLATYSCGAWKDDWHEYIGLILTQYLNEFAWFDMLRRELWS